MSSNKKRGNNYRRARHDFLTTLFSRMLAVYLTVTLILILTVGVTVVALLHQQTKREAKSNLLTLVSSVSDTLSQSNDDTAEVPSADCDSMLQAVASSTGTLIQVFCADGEYLHYNADDVLWQQISESGLLSYSNAASFPRRAVMEDCFEHIHLKDQSKHTITAKESLFMAGEERILLISAHSASFFDMVRNSSMEITLTMLLAILAALISVYATTERTIQPFMNINAIVQRYSKGDFNVRIPISGMDEATQLAKSFNNMADQLNDLENTRKSFVANVSHELRSPLTSMRGFLEAMQDGTIPPEERDKYIDIVLSETKRMTTMVNDLLDLARIESGKTVLKMEAFDINELIRRTLLTFEARIFDNDMDVDVKFAQEQYYVEADSTQISQVLRNLIDNAIKYSPSGSKLRIATYSVHREVYVSVQDSGQGIPEEDLPHVFDRFYKVEKAHTPTKQSGTGLGLSIVKRIIDQHGQSITVQSHKGKGTNFIFTLKRVAPTNKRQTVIPDGGIKNGI